MAPKKGKELDPLEMVTLEEPNVSTEVYDEYLPENLEDDYEYFEGYRPHNPGECQLPFAKGHANGLLQFKRFRHDESPKLNGSPQCGHWRIVKKDLVICGIKMEDVFVKKGDPAYPFDAFGYVPYGPFVKTGGDRECREFYLGVRPARANEAEQKIRARESRKTVTAAHLKSGADLGSQADKIAKAHYNLPQNSPAQVTSRLTPADEELQKSATFEEDMRKNMITTQQWDKLKPNR